MIRPAFCSTCIRVTPALIKRGHHWVCAACDPEDSARLPAASIHDRGYDVPDRAAPIGPLREAFAAGARRVNPNISTEPENRYVGTQATPGFIRVVVGRKQKGLTLDQRQALETLRGNSWFAELRYLGSDRRGYVFERPDVAAATAERRRAGEIDVAAGLAGLARGGR